MSKLEVFWSESAKLDLKDIYLYLKERYSKETALNIRKELYDCTDAIVFPKQFQLDEYRLDCRRIVVGNYKVLYQIGGSSISIVRIFNTFQNPLKSLK
ncbi:type II toxin-antitoxin system RelE/ParE family toxin [Flavobacterium soyae]|uniref:type II toxin-antitoxin system RelE/ParE family toxin n=1 Tax=Flavobacterium soyae TaxID=2903098 RepID=UPI001E6447C4|nr:type II toxin-antitoxin system RelE/ParE family toxin [Flavobacterium soyae]MCD9574898.1 type II toxin-antitoxin system RelE/ParE family toxin [Flavobacterium soyae]